MLLWVFYLPWGYKCHENRFAHHSCSASIAGHGWKIQENNLSCRALGEESEGEWDRVFHNLSNLIPKLGEDSEIRKDSAFLLGLCFSYTPKCKFLL